MMLAEAFRRHGIGLLSGQYTGGADHTPLPVDTVNGARCRDRIAGAVPTE